MSNEHSLRVHDVVARSSANGPGVRFVLWVQGCTLGCPGCFNPATHDVGGGETYSVDEVFALMTAEHMIDGVTYSGGEPLQQLPALTRLVQKVRDETRLSQLLFTGFRLTEIQRMPLGMDVLSKVDAAITGRYEQQRHMGKDLLGSSNQEVVLLTTRFSLSDFADLPTAEVSISPDGTVVATGVDPAKIGVR